ncbi:MAG: dihydrolipoyl dehydrogenase [Gammaproteobacteria bacterium]|nr:dihydrolipoyl dehydrogenase [Gammaproteobacteria bacterium]
MTRHVDVAIIGAGSAGLYALGQVKHLTDNYLLIDGGELGTTCARVGCMPSKVMIQIAEDFHRRSIFDREGIEGKDALTLNIPDAMEHVQDLRDTFVDRTLSHSTDNMDQTHLLTANVRFIDSSTLITEDGETIRAKKIIIATGSSPLIPQAWSPFLDHILTTDDIFELEELPGKMAIIGLGVIGIEIGQALSRMGVEITGIDQSDIIAGIDDDAINKTAIEILSKEFPLWLGHGAEMSLLDNNQLQITAGDRDVIVDKVLVCIGRKPNLGSLDLDKTNLKLGDNGIPEFDPVTMQTSNPDIFIAGDCTGSRALLHEAGFEGRVAGFNAMHDSITRFKQKTPLAITFSDPNIVAVGAQLSELDPETTAIGEIQLAPVGRALIMGKNRGLIRIYADKSTGNIQGASMICVKGENLAHLLCWSIEMGLTVHDLLKMPFYHPVIEEALQAALYDLRSKVDTIDCDYPVELQPLGN